MSKNVVDSVWENVKSILIAVVLAVIIKTSIVEAYKIPTGSMEDTLLVGDFLIANKVVYGARLPLVNWRLPAFSDVEQGDIVIFRFPRDQKVNYIKRCVAVGGQTVEIKDKVLYVDGVKFANPEFSKYTDTLGRNIHNNFGPYIVPEKHYFMMGDNRDSSYDSRYWGPVSEDLILGEAMFIHWSWGPDTLAPAVSVTDPISVPKLFVYNVAHFADRVRWERLFDILR